MGERAATDDTSGLHVVRVERSRRHYTLLRAPDGSYLRTLSGNRLGTTTTADDAILWAPLPGGDGYRHVVSEQVVSAQASPTGSVLLYNGTPIGERGEFADQGAAFVAEHGPAERPSRSLRAFRDNGWVCLPGILDEETVAELQCATSTGKWSGREYEGGPRLFSDTPVLARVAAEAVSLWLVRGYLGTPHVRLAHTPSIAILAQDDGERDVQGWHSDFPYLWGIGPSVERVPLHGAPGLALGVQRNVCITDFTKENGATCFKFGSHLYGEGPPEDWGTARLYGRAGHRRENGLPYAGPEAEVIEAPAGSIILYDARTWHRAGINVTEDKRAAVLQAMVPAYIMPFTDTSEAYRRLLQSPSWAALTAREQNELRALVVSRITGPGGEQAMAVDRELTRHLEDGPRG